jgi:phospholipase/carboxylesterase
LTTRIVGRQDAATTCVLLHGFGAPGDNLVGIAGEIDAPVRFVCPEAPIELGELGEFGELYGDARAWWLLDLARREDQFRRGVPVDGRDEIPEGLANARGHVMRLLDELTARFSVTAQELVLGGFSQGAMLALDVALHRSVPPAALILMSGSPIAQSVWQPRMASLAGVPVLLSHGRGDQILPFHLAELLRDQLVAVGADVDWQAFSGGHEIPPSVIAAAGKLLRARPTR